MPRQPVVHSKEMRQERESRNQFRSATEPDWLCTAPEVDLGEDLLVQVNDDGRSSGLSLFVQLKSVTKIRVGKQQTISQQLFVSNLRAWEDMVPPVFIVVWDVTAKKGYWRSVADIVRELDDSAPSWRNRPAKAKISARIPTANRWDTAAGRRRVRTQLALMLLPLVQGDRPFSADIVTAFPADDPDAVRASEALETLLAEGSATPARISGAYLKEFVTPDWYRRAFPDPPDHILLSTPAESTRFVLRMPTDEHIAELAFDASYVRGNQRGRFTAHAHRDSPVNFSMTLIFGDPPRIGEISLTMETHDLTAQAMFRLQDLYLASATGAEGVIGFDKTGPFGGYRPAPFNLDTVKRMRRAALALMKIEHYFGMVGAFDVPHGFVDDADLALLENLVRLLQEESIDLPATFVAETAPSWEPDEMPPKAIPTLPREILNVTIDTGEMLGVPTDPAALHALLAEASPGDELSASFRCRLKPGARPTATVGGRIYHGREVSAGAPSAERLAGRPAGG